MRHKQRRQPFETRASTLGAFASDYDREVHNAQLLDVTAVCSASCGGILSCLGSFGTAQAQVPDGFVLHEGHKAEFTIALPQGWTVYDQGARLTGTPSPVGMLVFTSSSPEGLEIQAQLQVLAKMDTGEAPSFFVDRSPAKKGTTCGSFPENAQKDVAKLIQRSLSGANVEPPRVEVGTVGGCQGLRVRMDVRAKNGTEWIADVRAVSNGSTLYLFSLRNLKGNFEKNLNAYEKAMSTLRMAVAP